jgi:F-type H+/Na+-transporting ATPase subunit alpha
MPLADEVMVIYAGTRGYTDTIPLEQMKNWEAGFRRFMESSHPEIGRDIGDKKLIAPETEEKFKEAIKAFNAGWQG